MPALYEIKSVRFKGEGIFATRNIESGTTILQERSVMRLTRPTSDATIKQAFNDLSPQKQAMFLTLHEGAIGDTKLARIYKANAFESRGSCWVDLKTAKTNHSCRPNAEAGSGAGGGTSTLEALKDIAEGEEICISYMDFTVNEKLEKKTERRRCLWNCWQFYCECVACLEEDDAEFKEDEAAGEQCAAEYHEPETQRSQDAREKLAAVTLCT